jgi:hypothetical protein
LGSLYPDNNLGISDINISNNILRNAPVMIYIIGHNDYNNVQPTVTSRVTITNNLVQNASGGLYDVGGSYCDPRTSPCRGYFIWQFLGGEDIIIRHNTIDTLDGAFLNFVHGGDQFGANFQFTDNILPMRNDSTYDPNGITVSYDWGQGALNRVWRNGTSAGWQFAGNTIFGNANPIHPMYNTPYPVGNRWLPSKSAVGFAPDFSLLPTSTVKNTALDGTDPGINGPLLIAATAHTISGGSTASPLRTDLNSDGIVNMLDILIVISQVGGSCTADIAAPVECDIYDVMAVIRDIGRTA